MEAALHADEGGLMCTHMQSCSSSRKIDSSRSRLLWESCLSAFTCQKWSEGGWRRRGVRAQKHLALEHAVVQATLLGALDHLDGNLAPTVSSKMRKL